MKATTHLLLVIGAICLFFTTISAYVIPEVYLPDTQIPINAGTIESSVG